MKNILALIGLAVVLVAGLGWYLGWYQIGTEPGSDGHRKINVDVNTKKILEDEQNLQKKVSGALSNDNKGTPVTPTPATPNDKVETTGFKFENDGSVKMVFPKVEFKTTGQ